MVLSLLLGASVTFLVVQLLDNNEQPLVQQPSQNTEGGKQTNQDILSKIGQAYNMILSSYVEKVDEKKLIEGAIQGMVSTLNDPYSAYMDEETAAQFNDSLESSFEGIGAEVSMMEGKVTIV